MFGKRLSERIYFIVRFFKNLQGTSTLVLGGEFTVEKLLFIQACLGFFQNICLVGEFGITVAKWTTSYIPDTRKLQSGTDKVFRHLFDLFRANPSTRLHLPVDILAFSGPPPKEEQAVDPKAKKGQAKEEEPQDPRQIVFDKLKRGDDLTEEEKTVLQAGLAVKSFRSFDIEAVEEWEVLQKEDLERIKKEEEEREEKERLRREEEAAKDPKKKKEQAKPAAKDADKKTSPEPTAEIESKVGPYFVPSEGYYTEDLIPISYGEGTTSKVVELASTSDSILWLGACSVSKKQETTFDKVVSKLLRTRAIQAAETTPQADSDKPQLKIGVVGGELISLIDSFDLKDPPPPKQKKYIIDEDGEEEEAEEEGEGEEEEEEDEFDEDDLSSAEIRRRRKKNNIDQITDLYTADQRLFLKLMNGEYIEGIFTLLRT